MRQSPLILPQSPAILLESFPFPLQSQRIAPEPCRFILELPAIAPVPPGILCEV